MKTSAVFGGNAKAQFDKQWKSLTVLGTKKHEYFIFRWIYTYLSTIKERGDYDNG